MKTIICSRPGMRRAGVAHAERATHPDDMFTPEQWEAIDADPAFAVIDAGDQAPVPSGDERRTAVATAVGKVPNGQNATVAAVSEIAGFKVTGAEIKAAVEAAKE
ncbi:HI1506-related protein [Oceaniradius stylonematis]|uniref:HI1506-related protein n=1 Tax=Oceaniradius stylonematis TaxID=2184161 RepID=UPI00273E15D2|nr:HI1506-related protein [Oceaniradius stylonematis]